MKVDARGNASLRVRRAQLLLAALMLVVLARPFALPRPYRYEVDNSGDATITVRSSLAEGWSAPVTVPPRETRTVTAWRRSGTDSAVSLSIDEGASSWSCGYQSGVVPQRYRVAIRRGEVRCNFLGADFLAVFPGL